MSNSTDSNSTIRQFNDRTIVSLKIYRADADRARRALDLAPPLSFAGERLKSVWLAPNHWLLVTCKEPAKDTIVICRQALGDILHHAVDLSAALAAFQLETEAGRSLLAAGCGVDLRPSAFTIGAVRRTRLAGIEAILIAASEQTIEVLVDRSLRAWLNQWLTLPVHAQVSSSKSANR